MSIKSKLNTLKNNTVTYFKENGKSLGVGALVGVALGTVYVLKQHSDDIENLNDRVYVLEENPRVFTENEDGTYTSEHVYRIPKPEVADQ